MRYRLKSYDQSPPGQYPFEQREGIYKKFKSQPTIEFQAQVVSNFRKGNGLPRASFQETLQDVDSYQCERLGNMPSWCCPADSPAVALAANSPYIAPPCQGCGAPVQ